MSSGGGLVTPVACQGDSFSCLLPTVQTAGFVITEDEPHTSGVGRLVADLRSLVGSRLLSDVLITTRDGQEVPAHGVILAARCPALRKV